MQRAKLRSTKPRLDCGIFDEAEPPVQRCRNFFMVLRVLDVCAPSVAEPAQFIAVELSTFDLRYVSTPLSNCAVLKTAAIDRSVTQYEGTSGIRFE